MNRVIAIAACGLTVSACSSSMPGLDWIGGSSAPAAVSLAVESEPAGAEAQGPNGSCRTPCTLNVAASGPFTVTVTLAGYVPQSIPVQVVQPQSSQLGSDDGSKGSVRLDPNPIYVELEHAPTAPAKKKPARKHPPATAANHGTATKPTPSAAASQPAPSQPASAEAAPAQSAAAPPAPAASAQAPWPMPR
jgi:hypothetical protein